MAISTALAQTLILKIGKILENMGLAVVYRKYPNTYEVVMFHPKEKSYDEAFSNGEVYRIAITGSDEEEHEESDSWEWEWDEDEEEEEGIETFHWSLRHSIDQQGWVYPVEWASLKTGKKLPHQISKKLHIQNRRKKKLCLKTLTSKSFPSLIKIQKYTPTTKVK